MPDVSSNNKKAINNVEAYVDSWEHLGDELRRLNLLIHLQVLKQQNRQPSASLDQLMGLVLSKEEIDRLLAGIAEPMTDENVLNSNDGKIQSLMESLSHLECQIRARRTASLKDGIYLSLPHLAQLFSLTPFEENCIIICLAQELDCKYEKLYAYLQNDVTRKKPSIDLMLNLHCHTRGGGTVHNKFICPNIYLVFVNTTVIKK